MLNGSSLTKREAQVLRDAAKVIQKLLSGVTGSQVADAIDRWDRVAASKDFGLAWIGSARDLAALLNLELETRSVGRQLVQLARTREDIEIDKARNGGHLFRISLGI
jgi:hypothetical protein